MRALVLAALAVAGCTSFDYIAADQCGNGILETGEDCDLVPGAPKANACVACRYRCGTDPNGELVCPDGFGCGDDGTCRRPSGSYLEIATPLAVEVSDFVVADLDGDPYPDVLGFGPRQAWMARGLADHGFALVDRFATPRLDVRPAIGDVDGDIDPVAKAIPDLVFSPGPRAVAVLHSGGGHLTPVPQPWLVYTGLEQACEVPCPGGETCTPQGCASACLAGEFACPLGLICESFPALGNYCVPDPGPVRVVAAVRTSPSSSFHELVTVNDDGVGLAVQILHKGSSPSTAVTLPRPVACDLRLLDAVADLDGDAVDELLLGCEGDPGIQLIRFVLDGDGAPQPVSVGTLSLPDVLAGPIVVADLDGDGRADVLATVAAAAVADFAVIRQTAPLVFAAPTRDARLGDDVLLAAADLDDDGATDLVSDQGIFLARGATLELAAAAASPWSEAQLADVNRDGRLDVIAAAAASIETLLGGPLDLFAAHRALTDGALIDLAIGDVDGDRFLDVTAGVRGDAGDEVAILYGAPDGLHDALTPAGAIGDTIVAVTTAQLYQAGTMLGRDDIAEVVVTTSRDLTVFVGGLVRPPLAPLDPTVDPRALLLGKFAPESFGGNDLLVLPASGQAIVGYGGSGARRDLAQQYAMTPPANACPISPAVTAVVNLDDTSDLVADAANTIIELSCSQGSQTTVLSRYYFGGGPAAPTLTALAFPTDEFGTPFAIEVADLDGNGRDDVITAHHDTDFADRVRIYWNDDGSISEANSLDLDTLTPLLGLTAGNVDDDLALEVVLGGFEQRAYKANRVEQRLDPVPVPGGEWLVEAPGVPRFADLDHDGVDDLVLGGAALRVFRAVPR